MSLKSLLQKFLDRLEEQLSAEDALGTEFLALRDLSRQLNVTQGYEAVVGATEENIKKNRYKDIRPFDYSRVSLCPVPGVPGSDYINANFIKGPNGRAAYIASQGPMPHTVDDFWAMLWQYNIQVVVMACNEREASKAKCERYWAYSGEEKTFRGITVRLIKEEMTCEDFMIRHLVASDGTEERSLQQFHYVNWPDHGAPESCTSLIDMIAMMRVVQPSEPPPIVVHCSAGCGRTGTICAVDYAWNVLKSGGLTKDFNIYNIIVEMRQQRPSIVQSKDQYILVHQAIAELFEYHLSMIKDHLYENVMVEGAGRPVIEEEIYEDVGRMNIGKKDEVEEDIYVNADELPIKRLSSHAAEKIIMETVANMVTDEDDETPDKFYSVSQTLSKINAEVSKVTKSSPEEKVKVRPGPPDLPVKKNNHSDRHDDRRSEPLLSNDNKSDKVPAARKFSLGSFKKKDRGKTESSQNTIEEHKSNVNELRQKLEHTGIGVGVMMPTSTIGKGKTSSGEKVSAQKPEKPSHKPDLLCKPSQKPDKPIQKPVIPSQKPDKPTQKPDKPTQKPDKPTQKPDKHTQKPDKPTHKPDKPIQNLENSKLDVVKELLQRKHSAADVFDGASRPEPAPRVSRGNSVGDISSEQPKDEKRTPLPLPRGNKPRGPSLTEDAESKENVPLGNSEYSEPYELLPKPAQVGSQYSDPGTGNVLLVAPPRLKLETGVSCSDDGYSLERRTIEMPEWIDDDDPYSYAGGGPTGGVQEKEKEIVEDDNSLYSVVTPRQRRKQLIANAVDRLALASENGTFPFQENAPDTSTHHDPALSSTVRERDPSNPSASLYSSVDEPSAPSFNPLIKPFKYTLDSESESETETECNLNNPKRSMRSRSVPFEQAPKHSKIPDRSFSLTPSVDNVYEVVRVREDQLGKSIYESLSDGQNTALDVPSSPSDLVPPDLPPRSPIDAAPSPDISSAAASLNQLLNTTHKQTSNPPLAPTKNRRSPSSSTKQLSTFFLPSLVQGSDLPTDEFSSTQVPHKPLSHQHSIGASASLPTQDTAGDDCPPPVPIKSFEEDRPVVPARSMPELLDQVKSNEPVVKDTRSSTGKFKFTFSTFKSKFHTGSSSLDNISLRGDDSKCVTIPEYLAFPNRIDKPKGGRPAPWGSSDC